MVHILELVLEAGITPVEGLRSHGGVGSRAISVWIVIKRSMPLDLRRRYGSWLHKLSWLSRTHAHVHTAVESTKLRTCISLLYFTSINHLYTTKTQSQLSHLHRCLPVLRRRCDVLHAGLALTLLRMLSRLVVAKMTYVSLHTPRTRPLLITGHMRSSAINAGILDFRPFGLFRGVYSLGELALGRCWGVWFFVLVAMASVVARAILAVLEVAAVMPGVGGEGGVVHGVGEAMSRSSTRLSSCSGTVQYWRYVHS